MLASSDNPLEHVLDHPWTVGGKPLPWMSDQIAMMLLVAAFLAIGLPLLARRRRQTVPSGPGYYLVELLVSFVRDHMAPETIKSHPAFYVPYFATLLCFLVGCNLAGLLPLGSISAAVGMHQTPLGGTPTGSIYVCAAMSLLTLAVIVLASYWKCVQEIWRGANGHPHLPKSGANLLLGLCNVLRRRRWPLPVAVVGGVLLWLNNFVPSVPGLTGLVMWPILLALEMIGTVSKCVALCIRLFANMTAGHLLLAVVIGLAAAGRGWGILAGLPSGLGAVALMVLEVLVAVIQAYLFTFLSALFVGLAVNPQH